MLVSVPATIMTSDWRGGGAEDDAEAVLIVARSGKVHHFYGAAGETEGHRPEGALAGPIGNLVEGGSVAMKVNTQKSRAIAG